MLQHRVNDLCYSPDAACLPTRDPFALLTGRCCLHRMLFRRILLPGFMRGALYALFIGVRDYRYGF